MNPGPLMRFTWLSLKRRGMQMTYRELLRQGEDLLRQVNIEDYRTDAWLLLEDLTGMARNRFFLEENEQAGEETEKAYRDLLGRRMAHVPVQQLTGKAWFYGYSFKVTEDVLIPRQDTEVLVEEALKRIEKQVKILDLCTGSGCVLLTILRELEARKTPASGTGLDLSEAALKIAEENRERLDLTEKCGLIRSDLFSEVKPEERFDLITANPPYIQTAVIEGLCPEVRDHEPALALDGGPDGLTILKKIAEEAPAYLKKGGWLLMEMGYDQGAAMERCLRTLDYEQVSVIKDLGGNDRVIAGRKK